MSHATAYVQYVDEDPALELAALVKRLQLQSQPAASSAAAKEEAESIALIEAQNYAPLLQKVAAALPVTVASASVEDFELAYHVFFAQLERTEISAAQRSALVPILIAQLSVAEPAAHAPSKVKLLVSLFNLLPPVDGFRANALCAALETAVAAPAAQNCAMLVSARTLTVAKLDMWRSQWTPAPQPALWHRLQLAIARILTSQQSTSLLSGAASSVSGAAANTELASTARLFWVRALQTSEAAGLSASASAGVVSSALVAALRDMRSVAIDEFLTISSVQAAEKSEPRGAGALVSIVRSLSSGSLADSLKLIEQNAAYLESVGVSVADISRRARLTALCSAFSRQSVWPLASLASELSLTSALDAERLVVYAAAAGLVGAKIDQETDEVAVEYSAPRTSSADSTQIDWSTLRTRVHAWRDSISSIMQTFVRAREGGAASILQRM